MQYVSTFFELLKKNLQGLEKKFNVLPLESQQFGLITLNRTHVFDYSGRLQSWETLD